MIGDTDDVTFDGRLFQVLAAATGNARSPIVDRRVNVHLCFCVMTVLRCNLASNWEAQCWGRWRAHVCCWSGSPATGCKASAR